MAEFKEIPEPNYDYDVRRLVSYYERALADLQRELAGFSMSDMQAAQVKAVMASIVEILGDLNVETGALAADLIEQAATDGVKETLITLGAASTAAEAAQMARFNKLNKAFVSAQVADTQADLLAVTQNVERRVRAAVRKAAAEAIRANVTQGVNGTATMSRDIQRRLYETLGEAADTSIIDSIGRRWKLKTYVDMLVRTKALEAHKEAAINEAAGRNVLYGVISSHGAKDACRNWEGKVVKLTPDAPGDYPYVGDLPRREIFHVNCKHVVTPVRRPDRLPANLRELNDI